MPWTTPTTWTPGQVVGASDLNAQVRDNQLFLFSGRPLAQFTVAPAFAYTATTFIVVNTSTCRLSFTTSHANAKILIGGGITGSSAVNSISHYWDMLIDAGSTYASGGTSSGNGLSNYAYGSGLSAVYGAFSYILTFAVAGAHTLDLVVRSSSASGGSVTMATCSATEVG
jgi:hypothetical protein